MRRRTKACDSSGRWVRRIAHNSNTYGENVPRAPAAAVGTASDAGSRQVLTASGSYGSLVCAVFSLPAAASAISSHRLIASLSSGRPGGQPPRKQDSSRVDARRDSATGNINISGARRSEEERRL